MTRPLSALTMLLSRHTKRRDFITLLGGAAAAWPLAARAQQPAMPVIGFLNGASPDGYASNVAAFHQGLKEAGYVDGQNVTIEYRWAENQYDRLPSLAADLVQQKVTVIAATTTPAALAAKAATSTVPIVFTTGGDPIKLGLVASLRRPGGNMTGSTQLSVEVGPKRLELARELFPGATTFALLVNPANPLAATVSKDLEAVADTLGMRLHVLHASTEADFETAFATAAQLRVAALVISTPEPWFGSHAAQLGALALRHSVPAIYFQREFAAAGDLMSYGGSVTETYRLAGLYAGRILKGEKPADLPVVQSAKVELILNLKTARALGITIPLPLSGRADEVIE
jgi:putative tryptophan/tyrosine transport system substrate-binding protein